ncbi:MAG: hypothetical protein QOK49_4049 [Baekduia sp.]|jgi:glyoxylase I family protein|nr:hypothetical protein [Baekduia sp.]
MAATHVFAGVPVADIADARAWYERLLDRAPDLVPNASEAAWRVTDSGWICLIADPDHAGSSMHTVLVEDLDDLVAGLRHRGLAPSAIETMPGAARTSTIADPDGNRLQFGQPIAPDD